MTVRNVLRARPGVSEGKRRQVLSALKEMGVEVGTDGASVNGRRKRRGKTFLLVEAGVPAGMLQSPVYSELVRGIEEGCVAHGRALQVAYTRNSSELGESARGFHGEGVLLFGPEASATPFLDQDSGLATVRVLHEAASLEASDRVTYDDLSVGVLAARWLLQRGCRRPAFIGGKLEGRGSSFRDECLRSGVEPIVSFADGIYLTDGVSQSIDHTVLGDCFSSVIKKNADGLFVYSDQIAAVVYSLLVRARMLPMDEIPVVSCNREQPFLSLLDPLPATIDILIREIGRRAVARLVERIENPEAPRDCLILQPILIPPDDREPYRHESVKESSSLTKSNDT